MTDKTKENEHRDDSFNELSRRGFVVLSLAAGLAGVTSSSAGGAGLPTIETAVDVKTPDGTCDAVFIHPAKGSHPGVLMWVGQRPEPGSCAGDLGSAPSSR
jgi:hypothetical protein